MPEQTRRTILRAGALGAAALVVPWAWPNVAPEVAHLVELRRMMDETNRAFGEQFNRSLHYDA